MTKIDKQIVIFTIKLQMFWFYKWYRNKIIGKIGLILTGIYPQQCNVLGTTGDQYEPSWNIQGSPSKTWHPLPAEILIQNLSNLELEQNQLVLLWFVADHLYEDTANAFYLCPSGPVRGNR